MIYDWNARPPSQAPRSVALLDETLRDGLLSASVIRTHESFYCDLLRAMPRVGASVANLGHAGARGKNGKLLHALLKTLFQEKLSLRPAVTARTHENDIQAAVELSQRYGQPIELMIFTAASGIRRHVEGWSLDQIQARTKQSLSLARRGNLPVCFVFEDATRTDPATLSQLLTVVADNGVKRICLADTVGHVDPFGAQTIVHWAKETIRRHSFSMEIDWHGHNDAGLSLANALAAAEAGASRVHATAFGIGERTGNTPIEQWIFHAKRRGWMDVDLAEIPSYVWAANKALGLSPPANQPIVGTQAFTTAAGTHGAAISKALAAGDIELADALYSAVPASVLQHNQGILVGPYSGTANAQVVLSEMGLSDDANRVEALLKLASDRGYCLSDMEIHAIMR